MLGMIDTSLPRRTEGNAVVWGEELVMVVCREQTKFLCCNGIHSV